MKVPDSRSIELKILLEEIKYSDVLLKLGKEIGEPYCLQFNDSGYDQQYNHLDLSTAITKITEKVTNDELVSFFSRYPARGYTFLGNFYAMRDGTLTLGTEWPTIKDRLVKLAAKHGDNLAAVLQACYTVCIEKDKQWKNYLHIEATAKELGTANFRAIITDLELAEVLVRHKGDIKMPRELAPLVQEFLKEIHTEEDQPVEIEEDEPVKIPEDMFDVVVGHERLKKLFTLSLQAPEPVHILLAGPPATAKSIFLMELERLPRSRYALGGTSSKAGIVDFIIEQRPRYLILDELEKMDMKDFSALLSLMADGVVTRLKKGMTEKVKVKTWVFAAVNREENLPPELKSRFLIRRLTAYNEQDYKEVVRSVLVKREHETETIANEIADRMASLSRDVRDAVKVARLHKGQQSMPVSQVIELAFQTE
ncbi:hypothetical protein VLL09_04935 [Dehalococcoides mccartyi]|uniref:MCM C-terminal AAA(+) ATPase domain-containing protein n=1 Tax=Dehalococcoides mccartyi TaxID=61435 RepID=A0AB38Z829_9CHLR|nr:hypothetical protein [Dehalococcoides mccartyi]WRO06738.1 hypothetical protein VLL09_04935 [Dehalococcoides mccartyi]